MSPVRILKRLVSVFINACRLLSASEFTPAGPLYRFAHHEPLIAQWKEQLTGILKANSHCHVKLFDMIIIL